MDRCGLCDPRLGPILTESEHWRLVLNRNQDLLGKCFLALRHLEAVPSLTPDEWLDLHTQVGLATRAVTCAFHPVHFNYAFLQNQDRHVHLHVVPRYAGVRQHGGVAFADPDYPDHYDPDRVQLLSPDRFAALADLLRRHITAQGG